MIARRISKIYRAIAGHALNEIEVDHAEAMLHLEREELRKQVASYNRGLASHAALCERLRRQIDRLDKEEAALEVRTSARLEAGDREAAARHALRLEAVASEREELTQQRDQAESGYREMVRARTAAVDAARAKIEALRRSIGECRVQEALADLSEMAAGMRGAIGSSEGDLARLQECVDERRDQAAGRMRVARDAASLEDAETQEREQAMRATHALDRFEARLDSAQSSA